MSQSNIRKIYARMMKIEVTKLMVDAVYKSLTTEDQEFIKLRYSKKKQMMAISLALNISVAQLNIRHHVILTKTAEFMLYKLDESDIFEPYKIASMIKLLGRIIEFADEYDSAREFINKGWVEAIADRRDKYADLLKVVDEAAQSADATLHSKIVSTKLKNPSDKIETLSMKCNVDKSVISRHLKNFVDSVRKYLD